MARNVQHVVDAAHDREITGVLVAHRAVAGEIELAAKLIRVIRLAIALGIAPDRSYHGGPRFLDDENAAMPIGNFVPRLVDDRRHDAGQRQRARPRHGCRNAGER